MTTYKDIPEEIERDRTCFIEAGSSIYVQRERESMLEYELNKILKLRHPAYRATAQQRCEALLRTLGKWEESK
jgi:hypothetical protein